MVVRYSAKSAAVKKAASRMGVSTSYLSRRWKEVKRQQEAYRGWRRRYVKSMERKTGMSEKQLLEIGAVPTSVNARMEDFGSKEEMTAFLKVLRQTRASWTKRKAQVDKLVKRSRQRTPTTEEIDSLYPGLTTAQKILLARLDGATLLTEDEWNQLLVEVSQMSDEEIAEFYSRDENLIFKWLQASSPKVLARKNEEADLDADTAQTRFAHFESVIQTVKTS